jgi:hypothetical protein
MFLNALSVISKILDSGYFIAAAYLSGFSKHAVVVVGISAIVLPVLVAGVTSYGIALFYANWQEVRSQSGRLPAHGLSFRLSDIVPLVGVIAFLPLAVVGEVEVYDLQVFALQEPNLNLSVTLHVLIPLAGCVWIVGMAALITGRRLETSRRSR